MHPLKLVFAGTPEFARVALAALVEAGHEVALVLTQPDRPAGRGLKLQASPVKQFALTHGLAVEQPRSLRLDGKYQGDARAAQALLQAGGFDAMVVAAYGLILPQWVLDTPRLGCFNIHASLLPRWRGAAPIHRAIEAGDRQSGVTIMQMDAGLDTGAMLAAQSLPIDDTTTTASLHDALAHLGATLLLATLQQAARGELQPQPQPEQGVTYASKVDKHEAVLDWRRPAQALACQVRAFNPNPVASTQLNGEPLKVWSAHPATTGAPGGLLPAVDAALPECGTIMAVAPTGIAVAAMNSILILTELQRAGGKRLPLADFLRGFALVPGMRLG